MVSTRGPAAVKQAKRAGLILDPWQQFVLDVALGEQPKGADEPAMKDPTQWSAFEVALVVPRQNGKGDLGLDTPILTTDGWETMGSIRVGQYVYGADGTPTKVVACSEVFTDHNCYEVRFTDGASYVAGADHLWHVRNKSTGRWENRSTDYLASRFGKRRTDNGRMEYNFRVRCDVSPDAPDADLPIDPYLFGFWLGDGTSTSSTITVGHDEKDWVVARLEQSGARVISTSVHDHGHAVGLRFRLDAKVRDGFESRARRLGVWGNKHIPDVYLTASTKQRRALLAGLLDSDGSIAVTNRSPQVEFSTSFPALADGFHRLARSLGIRVARSDYPSSFNGQRFKDRSRFMWTPTFDPFDMPRKSARFAAPATERQSLMSIVGVDRVATVPTRCIQVDRADGVYLVGHFFTPTHNSILEARTLAGLFLFGERLILHSAHEVKTALEAYRRLRELIEGTPELHKQVRLYSESNGKEGIELHNGARVRFVARSKGSGRGFSADCVILDEAYELSTASVAALLPTLGARAKPQVWYTSSAALASSSQLHSLIARGRGVEPDERLAFLEWAVRNPDAVPKLAGPDLEAAVAEGNPGLGIRLSMSFAMTERRVLRDTWPRERLGVHDDPIDDEVEPAVDLERWGALADGDSEPEGGVVFVVDVSPKARSASISMGAMRADGLGHVELVDHREGVEWVKARRAELAVLWPGAVWALDPSGPAVELRSEGEWREITAKEAGEAFGWLSTSVGSGALRWRVGSTELAESLLAAMTNAVPGEYADGVRRWSRRRSSVDITPLVAVTLAAWAGAHVEVEVPAPAPFALFG